MRYPNIIQLEISGRHALFTDPLTRTGGEKCSYPIPTYEALKGIMSSIYWLPDITWIVDAVRIMAPICTESRSIVTRGYFKVGCDLSVYTYLKNVRYRLKAHFVPNTESSFSAADEHRHYHTAQRMLRKGGRRDIFLGTRDCPCSVAECAFDEGKGFYDDISCDMGMMFHGFTYVPETDAPVAARYFRCHMENGTITFPKPQECTYIHQLHKEKHHALV